MTIDERAEEFYSKIRCHLHKGQNCQCIEWIAAEICAAAGERDKAIVRMIQIAKRNGRSEEREACAKIAEDHMQHCSPVNYFESLECFKEIAHEIRALKAKP